MNDLLNSLKHAGHKPVILQDKIMVLPFGGRVIGLYPDGKTNVFWVQPGLSSKKTACAFFRKTGWLNTGGARTWISPELDVFVRDLSDAAGTYEVPKALDPGSYKVFHSDEKTITLKTEMDLRFHRCRRNVQMELTKQINPYKRSPFPLPAHVSFAGYRMMSMLKAGKALPAGVCPAIWSLIQVPGGGRMIVPVKKNRKPCTYFGRPLVSLKDKTVQCKVKASAGFKFAIPADNSTGFAFYIDLNGNRSSLIVNKCTVSRKSLYKDPSWNDLSDTGYVQQFYVDDGKLGGFGELEYHSPALCCRDQKVISDTSEVWAFTGPAVMISKMLKDMIMKIKQEAL